MNWKNYLHSNRGQSLVEFVFLVPVFFLIFFALVQFANILDGRQKSVMAFWCGLRAPTIPAQEFVGKSTLKAKYEPSEIIGWIRNDVFSRNDIVDITIKRGSGSVILNTIDMDLTAYVPFLYQNTTWGALKNIFSARVIAKDGKHFFVLKYKGKGKCFTPVMI